MKKYLIQSVSIALALCAAAVFAGCGKEDNSSSQAETTAETTAAVEETTMEEITEKRELASLHEIDYEGDEFAGAWTITDGIGKNLDGFVFMFDGKKNAYLMIGTMGYCSSYDIKTETDENGAARTVFNTQLMYGLDGSYTFSFSDDKNMLTLTNKTDNSTSTLTRIASYSFIPLPNPDSKIDEQLLGAWKDEDGEYLYFDKSGIMYETIKGLSFTYYTYSAENGVITSTYTMIEDETEEFEYSFEGDTLVYNGYKYQKVSADELV